MGDLYIDYSKHRVTRETLDLLIDLARAAGLEQRRAAMFAGEHINTSEDRAVLHTALRLPVGATLTVDGQNVVADVHEVLGKMGAFTDRLRSGEWTGATVPDLPWAARSEDRSLAARLRPVTRLLRRRTTGVPAPIVVTAS